MNEPELIREMLTFKTVAVVGLSDRLERPSHFVSAYMRKHGYRVLPINPALTMVFGQPAFTALPILPQSPM